MRNDRPLPGLGGVSRTRVRRWVGVIDEAGTLRLNIEIVLSRLFGLPAWL
jgi:hypothetical protein